MSIGIHARPFGDGENKREDLWRGGATYPCEVIKVEKNKTLGYPIMATVMVGGHEVELMVNRFVGETLTVGQTFNMDISMEVVIPGMDALVEEEGGI